MQGVKKTLPEQDGHTIAFFEYGNPSGFPVIVFHGGPGSGSSVQYTKFFDLQKYRVILFDQRGCGESTPLGLTKHNTTEKILFDAERIREELGIRQWFVSGASWGSTLALLYAIQHPEKVHGILVSSIWLADAAAKQWEYTENGVARMMPDVWKKRLEFLAELNIDPKNQCRELAEAFKIADDTTQKKIAAGVRNWEGNLFSAQQEVSYKEPEEMTEAEVASAKIFTHYEANNEFIPDGYIVDNMQKIADIPAVIVHGRNDILCPLQNASQVAEKMNACTFIIATSSGHALTQEGYTIKNMAFDRFLAENTPPQTSV